MRIVKQPAAATEALINGAWPLGTAITPILMKPLKESE
jgi:hypothetical protein